MDAAAIPREPTPATAPSPRTPAAYAELLARLRAYLPAARLVTDPLRRLAWGTDASFYRLVPQIVVVVESEAEVVRLLGDCRALRTPVTFRAAGTSLSGQAISDSVLVVLGDGWRRCDVAADGATITLRAGRDRRFRQPAARRACAARSGPTPRRSTPR